MTKGIFAYRRRAIPSRSAMAIISSSAGFGRSAAREGSMRTILATVA
jgi:hypothetical protein